VGHRQLAQHRHYGSELPHRRDVRVGVGVLGRRYYYNGSTIQTLIERWDGTSWAIVSSPNPRRTATSMA